jgi:hypothetical protein
MVKAECRICRQCACRKCHPAACEGVNRSRRFFLLGALALPVAPKVIAAPPVAVVYAGGGLVNLKTAVYSVPSAVRTWATLGDTWYLAYLPVKQGDPK